jgi:hypothetical protein
MMLMPVRMRISNVFAVDVKVEERMAVISPETIFLARMLVDLYLGGCDFANQKFLIHRDVKDRGVSLMIGWLMVECWKRRLTKA